MRYGFRKIRIDDLVDGDLLKYQASTRSLVRAETVADGQVPSSIMRDVESTFLEGTPMFVYGSSFTVDPGYRSTAGMEWHKLLRDRLKMPSATTYGVSGKSIADAAQRIIGGKGAAGAAWTPGKKGLVVLDTYVNDVSMWSANGVANAYTAKTITGITNALRAALATLSAGPAGSTIEDVASAVFTGAWTTFNSTNSSGGSNKYTTTVGAKADFPVVPFPATGYVHLLVSSTDPLTYTPATVEILVDDVVVKTVLGTSLQCSQATEGSPTAQATQPAAIKVTATPGNHKVTIRHAGLAGQFAFTDAVLIPAVSPPPIFVVQDALPLAGGTYNQAAVNIMAVNKPQLDAIYATVLAEFANAIWVPTTLIPATDYAIVDKLHPNDRGMVRKTDELMVAIRTRLSTIRSDALYTTL